MAQLSLSECKWRMIRRVLKKKRFRFDDARNGTRHDQDQFDWLVGEGFFVAVGDDAFELTEKAKGAADLGFYEFEPRRPAAGPTAKPAKKAKAKGRVRAKAV